MERGHQHIGLAFVPAGNLFPAVTDEREQAVGHYSRRRCVRRHDLDCGRFDRAPPRFAVSARNLGHKPLRYGTFYRAYVARASQALSCTRGIGRLAAVTFRCHSSFKTALQANVSARSEGDHSVDSADHVAFAIAQAAVGESRAKPGARGETHRAIRAIYPSQ